MKIQTKDKRVQVYYDEVVKTSKLQEIRKRHWLHREEQKLYAYVRDYKQATSVLANTVSLDVDVVFILNFNKLILENYSKPIVVVFNGVHYKAVAQPVQYEYYKGDIKILAKRFAESKIADEDIYIQAPYAPPTPLPKLYVASIDGYVATIDGYVAQIGG